MAPPLRMSRFASRCGRCGETIHGGDAYRYDTVLRVAVHPTCWRSLKRRGPKVRTLAQRRAAHAKLE
jgi:hypothetical protein